MVYESTRVMQPARRATKEETRRWMREDPELISESESKPRPKSRSKATPTPASKQKTKASKASSSARKSQSAAKKPSGHRNEPLTSPNDTPDLDLDNQSGPSTSPSLAGTRSKRSLKVPARFSDPEFAFRDAVEPVRVNASREAKDAAGKLSTEVMKDDESRSSISTLCSESSMFGPASLASTPAPSTTSKSTYDSPVLKSKTASPSPKRSSRDERRENEDAVVNEPPVKIFKGTSRPSVTSKKQSVSRSTETQAAAASASPTRPPLEQVPDSVQASESLVKLEPAPTESRNFRQDSPSKRKKKKKSSSKPRTRSPEKVYNTDNIGSSADSVGNTIGNSVINMTIQPAQQSHKPQLQHLLQQPLPQIQQIHQLSHPPPKQIHVPPYGSRLLPIDQPILLPVSVAPIGPITTNQAAVNGALRRRPFVCPMFEMSIKHHNTIRQRLALENLPSMLRIASHLGIKDRIKLRQVNKTWKTIIDSETLWKDTIMTSADLSLDFKLLFQYLNRFRTTDLQIQVTPNKIPADLILALISQPTFIRRIYLNSTDRAQNTAVYNALQVIDEHLKHNHVKAMPFRLDNQNNFIQHGEIHWKPRVTVDGLGYLRVEISTVCVDGSKIEPKEENFIEEELEDLRAKFDWKSIYQCQQLVNLTIDCVSLC